MNSEAANNLLREVIEKTRIGTKSDAENSDYLVCGPKSYYPDDLQGNCSLCHVVIFWRPNAAKSPTRICIQCLLIETKGVLPADCFITPATAGELKARFLEDLTKK